MKKKKEFRPRTGIRFNRGNTKGPKAGFVVSNSINEDSLIRFDMMTSVTSSIKKDNITYQTKKYNAKLAGRRNIDFKPISTVIDADNTGLQEIPSWTRNGQSFVINSFGNESHEITNLNCFLSGTENVENTQIPATAKQYFSKNQRYNHVIVKKTASIEDTYRISGSFTAVNFLPGTGTDVTMVTGSIYDMYSISGFNSLVGSSELAPATIKINVPHKGKIVDLKVWVEFVNISGSGNSNGIYPLGSMFLAIRSPNLNFGHAHPIRNSENIKKVFNTDLDKFSYFSAFGQLGNLFFGPNTIADGYRSSFILWETNTINTYAAGPWDKSASGSHKVVSNYPSFQRDRNMRTIFCDSSTVLNPRHHIGVSTSQSFAGSPNSFFGINSAFGFDVPWTSQIEISGSNTYFLSGSPPQGWLTGPGGTNNINEWPTTGVNYGAETIKPLYPLLEPVFQRKKYNNDYPMILSGASEVLFKPDEWIGFRPGLYGTEASGTWDLLIGGGGGVNFDGYSVATAYFRQVRLEFILDNGFPTNVRNANKKYNHIKQQKNTLPSISGTDFIKLNGAFYTASLDCYVSENYTISTQQNELNSTFGFVLNTGSITNDYAVLYKITGTLADISGAAPSWLLNNRFGLPIIPESSSTLSIIETVRQNNISPFKINENNFSSRNVSVASLNDDSYIDTYDKIKRFVSASYV